MVLQVISQITDAASSYDLTTLEAMKMYLAIPDSDTTKDAFISDRITKCSAAIQKHCNNPIVAETRTESIFLARDAFPWQVPNNVQLLQLRRWPIIGVTSVVTTAIIGNPTILIQNTDFLIKQEEGQLLRLFSQTGFPSFWETVPTVIVYQGGYSTVPADVEDACQRMVEKSFWGRGRDPTLIERNQGLVGSERYWVTTGAEGNMPPEIADLLDQYRVPVIA